MPETNILQFPSRALSDPQPQNGDLLLAKIAQALRAMKDLHGELESLKARLKAEHGQRPTE